MAEPVKFSGQGILQLEIGRRKRVALEMVRSAMKFNEDNDDGGRIGDSARAVA